MRKLLCRRYHTWISRTCLSLYESNGRDRCWLVVIPSCFCGGCLTCAMHQEALALLARPHDLAKAAVSCTQRWIGGEPQGPEASRGWRPHSFAAAESLPRGASYSWPPRERRVRRLAKGHGLSVGVWARLGD